MSLKNFELNLSIPDKIQTKRFSEKQSAFIMAVIYSSNVNNYQYVIFCFASEVLCAFERTYML